MKRLMDFFDLTQEELERHGMNWGQLRDSGSSLRSARRKIRGRSLRTRLKRLEGCVSELENLLEKKISLNPQFEVVSEENTGRVDYAIQALEELMRETHIKLLLGSLRADTSAENAGLKARVAKLEQESRQSQNDFSPKELVNITESVAVYSPVCETNDVVSEVRLSIDNPVPASSKSSENRKTDAFMDEVNKKNDNNLSDFKNEDFCDGEVPIAKKSSQLEE
ncbi:hypothetical protein RhiirA1_400509 [Rhizophagus irregularis]|uniref:Uncharacterized protein n=1 Tax=Rhizophagus irregularis TaxID=588596 RepID=A0A2N0R5Q9_9GLOM|nr:hypothetical protein RhiirA1_400509 [Rhizophagus irregularis]